MPFENFDSNEKKSEPAAQGLDFLGAHSERFNAMDAQKSQNGPSDIPTARLVGLAGTTAGLTELVMEKIGSNSAKLFQENAKELMLNASGGPNLYNALDKLRVYQSTSLLSDINAASGPLSAATNKQVGHVINQGLFVTDALRERAFASSVMLDSSVKLSSEAVLLKGQFDQLSAGAMARSQMFEVMHSDRMSLTYGGAKLQTPLGANELRAFGEKSFSEGSLFRNEMVKHAAEMKAGETIAPRVLVEKVAPAWQARYTEIALEESATARMGAQIEALKNPSPGDLNGGLLKARHMNDALFKRGEKITTALEDYANNSKYMNTVEAKLVSQEKLLYEQANRLKTDMADELAKSSSAESFTRGFAKGALVMTAAIGAGVLVDKLMDREHLSIESPIGMGIDAAAGLTLLSKMPMRVKVPLAAATFAAPRILDKMGHGDILRPAALQGDSAWRPNAVDAIGLGLAAGLNVDGRIRLGIAATSIIAGRVYHVMNSAKQNQLPELDMSKFKIQY